MTTLSVGVPASSAAPDVPDIVDRVSSTRSGLAGSSAPKSAPTLIRGAPLVATPVWGESEIHAAQSDALQRLGYRHCFMDFDAPIPPGVAAVLVQGPCGSLAPLAHRLAMQAPAARPLFLYWFTECLALGSPEWLHRLAARFFSELHYGRRATACTGQLARAAPWPVRRRGTRLGFTGDLRWLHARGLLDVLAISGTAYAQVLRAQGIPAIVVARGHHASYGEQRTTRRDIHLLWMGKLRTRRRRAVVRYLQEEMRRRGLVMHIYDGEARAFIFGEKRTALLNRTWFVLNVNAFAPSDELSIRHFISAANGAVVLTEPTANQYPWQAGTHVVECSVEDMPERIEHYVSRPEEWRALSENMHYLATQELTLERSLSRIMQVAELGPITPATVATVCSSAAGTPDSKVRPAQAHAD